MRVSGTVLFSLLLLLSPAAAEQEEQPAKPLTPRQAADAVLEAVNAQDEASELGYTWRASVLISMLEVASSCPL